MEEDRDVRETFQRELDAKGIENHMDEDLYEPPEAEKSVWS